MKKRKPSEDRVNTVTIFKNMHTYEPTRDDHLRIAYFKGGRYEESAALEWAARESGREIPCGPACEWRYPDGASKRCLACGVSLRAWYAIVGIDVGALAVHGMCCDCAEKMERGDDLTHAIVMEELAIRHRG
jgi:hypothetical protein